MKVSLKRVSIILYLFSFCLPVFVNDAIPGFIAFAFGFVYMFTDPIFLIWLANLTYWIAILPGVRSKKFRGWFTGVSVLLASLFPIVFWNEMKTDGVPAGSYGIGFWFWFAAFVLALIDVMKKQESVSSTA